MNLKGCGLHWGRGWLAPVRSQCGDMRVRGLAADCSFICDNLHLLQLSLLFLRLSKLKNKNPEIMINLSLC